MTSGELTAPQTAQRGANAFARAYLDYRGDTAKTQVDRVRKTLTDQLNDLSAKKRENEEIASDPNAPEEQRRTAQASSTVHSNQLNNVDQQLLAPEHGA